ncbi:SapC family protein [Halomonas tibetensis]|uniref:SapC family protein n=1 Tax=Halomonas tibetensis TaxID=2259590 RepID=A0ABV7B5R3_9GAMM
MFKTLETLDTQKHADLHYRGVPGYVFAKEISATPLSASEVVKASRSLPVVFSSGDKVLPMALLSVAKESHPCVDEQGNWLKAYIPAHIRRYPFVLGETGEQGRFVVMIDRAADNFLETAEQGAEPLFQDDKPPEGGIVERARKFLVQFQRELEETQKFLAPLAEHDLLVERQVTLNRNGEQEVAVRGFRSVDAEQLAKLDDATLASWARSGLLGVVYAHLHSQENVQALLEPREEGVPAA